MLPPRRHGSEIKAGRLRLIVAVSRFRPLEFTATCSIATLAPIAGRITELAGKVSDFDKAAAKRMRTQWRGLDR